jgi:AbrB family looped-hinge helix DNA binding protein
MTKHNRLTVKGQVTIPKDVRKALGVGPGDAVAFEPGPNGGYVVRKAELDPMEYQRRFQAALLAIEEARRLYPPVPSDLTTDEYMSLIREHVPDPRAK